MSLHNTFSCSLTDRPPQILKQISYTPPTERRLLSEGLRELMVQRALHILAFEH